MKRLFVLLSFLLLITCACVAGEAQLAWDLSIDDAELGPAGGYRIYASKTSGSYTAQPAASVLPGVTTTVVRVPGFGNYCFVATAFSNGGESDYSNEVCGIIKPGGPAKLRIPSKVMP